MHVLTTHPEQARALGARVVHPDGKTRGAHLQEWSREVAEEQAGGDAEGFSRLIVEPQVGAVVRHQAR